MEILLWLVPPVVVTVLAMLWVGWLGREGRGEVDRDVAVRRLAEALRRTTLPHAPRRPPAGRDRSTGIAVRPSRAPVGTAPEPGAVPAAAPDFARVRGLRRMTQRTLAGLLAVPLLIGLWVAALVRPLPYVTYEPGPDRRRAREPDGKEIIQVEGHKTYRDDGELRMTTVYVSQPSQPR